MSLKPILKTDLQTLLDGLSAGSQLQGDEGRALSPLS